MLTSDINVWGPVGKEKEDEAWQELFIFENEMPAALLLSSSISFQQMSLQPVPPCLARVPLKRARDLICREWFYQREMRQKVFPFHDCFYLPSSAPVISGDIARKTITNIVNSQK